MGEITDTLAARIAAAVPFLVAIGVAVIAVTLCVAAEVSGRVTVLFAAAVLGRSAVAHIVAAIAVRAYIAVGAAVATAIVEVAAFTRGIARVMVARHATIHHTAAGPLTITDESGKRARGRRWSRAGSSTWTWTGRD